jgi:aldehyde dehydrogenase (NAD+)
MEENIPEILNKQDLFFKTHKTRDVRFRIEQLKKLKQAVKNNEQLLYDALWSDLRKSEHEVYASELGLFYNEIRLHIRSLRKWGKGKRVYTPIICKPSRSYIQPIPYGKVLIIGAFNYPAQLILVPLVGAISAGNTVVVKPSELSPKTAFVLSEILNKTFEEEYLKVIEGSIETSIKLLEQRWDFIFFTGSPRVGKIVMEAASKHLTPVALELGGKNPTIVDEKCNIPVAAKRIAWAKFVNAGQTCIAPDYVYVHEKIYKEFLSELKKHLLCFYSLKPEDCTDFSRIINKNAIVRLKNLLDSGTIYHGGNVNEEDSYISPTILINVSPDSPIMQEEIFGPILPVMTFRELDEVFDYINNHEKPLSAYFYSSDKNNQKRFLRETSSGDAGINDSVIHFVNHNLPFGGIGNSGMGSGYHGKHSFDVFSHNRSVLKSTTLIDLPFRYPPYKKSVLKIIKIFLR